MPLRRLTLHSTVALSLLGMGVVALSLVLLSANIYRNVSHENRASAVREQVRQQASGLLQELAHAQHLLALGFIGSDRFRGAWRAGDEAMLDTLLEARFEREAGKADGLPLQQLRLLDADQADIASAGFEDSARCPAVLAAAADRVVQRTCVRGNEAAMSVLVPLSEAGRSGFLEVVVDPLPRLATIGDAAGIALRIERPGGALLLETGSWARLASASDTVTTRDLFPGADGVPVFALNAATDVSRLNRQLADTRDFVLLAAGFIVAAAILIALVTLRRLFHPLRELQRAAEELSQDGAKPPGFEPVPERGPSEIATPIRSFNRMVERISGLLSDLEAEVAHRRDVETQATSARELAEAHARQAYQEKEFSQITLASVVDGVVATDTSGRIELMNPVAAELLGIAEGEARGRTVDDVVELYAVDADERLTGFVAAALADGGDRRGEVVRLCHPAGRILYVELAIVPMHDASGAVVGAVVVFHDVTQAHMLTERLTYQATHDALTGLINRYEFEGRLRRVTDAARNDEGNGVLCYLDLDQFKLVNDTCGHVAGDELLRQLAVMLTDRLGDRGTLARLGGDEFGLLMHPCGVPEARAVADELRDAIQRFRFVWAESIFSIGASVGLVEVTRESDSTDVVLSAADTACYMAKDDGRNRVQVYQSDDEALLARHAEMHWVSEVNRALEQDRFQLHYQDIVATYSDGEPTHFEILLRMVDESGRIWLPGAFLSAAERYNLAPAVDRWVIARAFRWLADNDVPTEARYAINLSGRSLADDGFLEYVLGELDRRDVAACNVCFEVTETAAISNLSSARRFMETLRRRGCRFSLDDFGSGLSSFTYLKNLPVDYLKIDGSFVRDIHRDPVHYAIVRSMNDVGHAMKMKTIAEFVENASVMRCLREIGVDLLQGFEYSRPRPLDPAEAPACTERP